MDLIYLVLIIAIAGFVVYLIQRIPMDDIFRMVIYFIVAVALVLFVIKRFSGNVPNVLN